MTGNPLIPLTLLISSFLLAPLAVAHQAIAPAPPIAPPATGQPTAVDETAPARKAPKAQKGAGQTLPTGTAGTDPNAVRSPYVIGPDDQLFIRVWKQGDLSGAVTVGPDGMISMQLINEVHAAGLTQEQLKAELVKRLSSFINEPEVNIQVVAVRSRTYIIQGEVTRTGVFPLTKPTTVLEALVNGGGFGAFANKKKIYILRGSKRIPFNWNDVSKGKHLEQNIEVLNGDQIFVP